MGRLFYIALGWSAVALGGLVGVILPVLPTTPFLLVAAFAFGKGSPPKARAWLIDHAHFGPPAIRNWEENGAISRGGAKVLACSMMVLVLAASLILGGAAWWVLTLQVVLIGTGGAAFILTRPDGTAG